MTQHRNGIQVRNMHYGEVVKFLNRGDEIIEPGQVGLFLHVDGATHAAIINADDAYRVGRELLEAARKARIELVKHAAEMADLPRLDPEPQP